MNSSKIMDLFPTPLYITKVQKPLNLSQKDYLLSAPTIPNMGNLRSENGYILNEPIFSELKQTIMLSLKEYVDSVYSMSNVDVYITQSWANYTKPNQYHHRHHHPNSFISGVYYVNAKYKEDMIKFYKDKTPAFHVAATHPNNYNSQDVAILVETGDLILFPSDFMHEVPPTTSEEVRISISFNTFLRGYIGDEQSSTALFLN